MNQFKHCYKLVRFIKVLLFRPWAFCSVQSLFLFFIFRWKMFLHRWGLNPEDSQECILKKMDHPLHIFHLFLSSQTNLSIFTSMCEKYPSSIRYWDSNQQPSDQGSSPSLMRVSSYHFFNQTPHLFVLLYCVTYQLIFS